MKTIFTFLLFTFFIVPAVRAQDICTNGQCVSAMLDGESFKHDTARIINALLYRQQASMDGRLSTGNRVSINLTGVSYTTATGSSFNEHILIEFYYEEDKTGAPAVYSITAHYRSGLYSMIRNTGSFTITDIAWQPDHRSFRLSANIDCVMRCWTYATDGKPDIHLTGSLSNILVEMPGWLVVKK